MGWGDYRLKMWISQRTDSSIHRGIPGSLVGTLVPGYRPRDLVGSPRVMHRGERIEMVSSKTYSKIMSLMLFAKSTGSPSYENLLIFSGITLSGLSVDRTISG